MSNRPSADSFFRLCGAHGMMDDKIRQAVDYLASQSGQPALGLVLGSGWDKAADFVQSRLIIHYEQIPHFPQPTAPGHLGKVVFGIAEGVPVVALHGRVHFYEGYSMAEVVFPIRVLARLGIRQLVVTNAAGGINPSLRPGDLMMVTDHINLMGDNPLIGNAPDDPDRRFLDMSEAYDAVMRQSALRAASRTRIILHQGIYIALSGPSYETPAEIRMCRMLGADAVGMSTVPEVIAANQLGIKVVAISCITNMATGILRSRLNHREVLQRAENSKDRMSEFLKALIPMLHPPNGRQSE